MSFHPHLGLLHPRSVPWIPRMMVLKGVFSLNKSSVMLGNSSIHHISASFHNREKANSVKIGTLKQVAKDGNDPGVYIYIWFDIIWPLHCEWLVSYSSVTPPDTWIQKKGHVFSIVGCSLLFSTAFKSTNVFYQSWSFENLCQTVYFRTFLLFKVVGRMVLWNFNNPRF